MDYSKLTIAELRVAVKEKGIRNVAGLKKAELVELLNNVEKMINKPVEVKEKTEKATSSTEKKSAAKKIEKVSRAKSSQGKVSGRKVSDSKKSESKASESKTSESKTIETNTAKTTSRVKTAEDKPVAKRNDKSPRGKDGAGSRPTSKPGVKTVPKPLPKTESPKVEDSEAKPAVEVVEEKTAPTQMAYDGQEYNPDNASGMDARGILEVLSDGFGFLRSDNYMPGEKDIYISPAQIRRFGLRTGDIVKGPIRKKMKESEKFSALLYIESVNGKFPSEIARRKSFEAMTPIFPNERIRLDYNNAPISLRIVDLFSPIGKGQRGMIVSPPKAGKTTLLKQIAKRISTAYTDMNLLVLLIDERPEEVTDIKESIEGPNVEVIYSTFDELPEHHKRVSEMVIERAKRLVESGNDVVILIDSITRLSRAYNLTVPPSGRTLSGGLDPAALHMPKKFFGAARNMREGGSLTILATALIDTGSRMDDVVFEEFKGTGNMELVLNRNLSEKRVFPAIDIAKSGTRKDDLLLDPDEVQALDLIHEQFRDLKPEEVTENILKLLNKTRNNKEFIQYAGKIFRS